MHEHMGAVKAWRTAYGTAIMLLGKAFRDGSLPFDGTKDALNALLGSEKASAKGNKKVA